MNALGKFTLRGHALKTTYTKVFLKYQVNTKFPSMCLASEKRRNKSRQAHRGSRRRTGYPNKFDVHVQPKRLKFLIDTCSATVSYTAFICHLKNTTSATTTCTDVNTDAS